MNMIVSVELGLDAICPTVVCNVEAVASRDLSSTLKLGMAF